MLMCLMANVCIGQETEALRQDDAKLLRVRFSRTAEEAFKATVEVNTDDMDEVDLFKHWVQAGDWKAIEAFLKTFQLTSAKRIHEKICGDLLYDKATTVLTLQDFVGLTDASPSPYTGRNVAKIGGLLQLALSGTESQAELVQVLKKGTVWLGDSDPEKRQYTAHVLANAKLYSLASQYGATESQLRAAGSKDPSERGSHLDHDNGVPFDKLLEQLNAEQEDSEIRERILEELYRRLARATPNQLKTMLQKIASDKEALSVYAMLGRETAAAANEPDFEARERNLLLQAKAIRTLSDQQLQDQRWMTLVALMSTNWEKEAQLSLTNYPIWIRYTDYRRDKAVHVPIAKLIEAVPGKVETISSRIRIPLARMILYTENLKQVQPHLAAIHNTDREVAVELANRYIQRWAEVNDPNLSEAVLKEYALEEQAVILTRAEQEASLNELGQLLKSLAPDIRALLDIEHLIHAFSFCHSDAEIHTRQNVEKVFGPVSELSEDLAVGLLLQMRNKLSGQWREMEVQEDAATRRSPEEVMSMVKRGYAEATQLAGLWLEAHPGNWSIESLAGSLHADWGEFAYFKNLSSNGDGKDRFTEYMEHSAKALVHFRKGAKAYAEAVQDLQEKDYDLLPFQSWFHGLLGITGPEDVNLRKGVTDQSLLELRQALLDLPGGAAPKHMQMFSSMVSTNLTEGHLAPEMKYRYLSSAVTITGKQATIYTAAEKIQYYDSLLNEIHLQARVDGSNKIQAGSQFGIFISLVHTADIARESGGFSNYLLNHIRRRVGSNTVTDKPMYRDRFEEAMRVGLANFFEVTSIAFADSDVKARDLETRPGWQETPLAYVLLKTRDMTVDRIPDLEMELDFFDRNGKVILPVPSSPVPIEISVDAVADRPVSEISISQIVDARELANGILKIDVSATARGIIPNLDQILDLKNYSIPITSVDDQATIELKELITNEESLAVTSQRSWTIHLDPTPLLRGASERIDFDFLKALPADAEMVYLRYDDLDPVQAAAKLTLLEGGEVEDIATPDNRPWVIAAILLIIAVAVAAYYYVRSKTEEADAPPPLFTAPEEMTPFSVLSLLYRIQKSDSVEMNSQLKDRLQSEIQSLEHTAFSQTASDDHWQTQQLRDLTSRWIQTANDMAVAS